MEKAGELEMLHTEDAFDFLPENQMDVLDRYISGFRRYRLQKPYYPTFVSQNLCDMLGYTKNELFLEGTDLYAAAVHPADKGIYAELLSRAAATPGSHAAEYRIVRRDGAVLCIRDSMRSERFDDGRMAGYSVLTDITELKSEVESLHFLNETVPCGILRYTCEKNPRITYINEQMLKMMRFPKAKEGEIDYLELYKDNIYLLLPMEERRRFSRCLAKVSAEGRPASGELSVLRCDGTRARLYGWITKGIDGMGQGEFQSVCIDMTERYLAKRTTQTEQYVKVLSEVYDKIFEYDFTSQTVRYVCGDDSEPSDLGRMRNIPMQMEEATARWIDRTVLEEDRASVRDFFRHVLEQQSYEGTGRPAQIEYRVQTRTDIQTYSSVFLRIDAGIGLFCCRRLQSAREDDLRYENLSLRNLSENMAKHFTDGIAAFEVNGDSVTPLYANDNVCGFFGFGKDEWLSMMKKSTSIRAFVSRCGVDYEKFMEFLEKGEAEFSYYDVQSNAQRKVKAVCSGTADASGPRYVMLYHMDLSREGGVPSRIFIRTFGYFDVFVNDSPIAFRNKKAKELLALLVDRRGGYVSSEEAIGFLWENEAVNSVTLARYRKEALRLKNTLEEYGIANIMESVDGKRRIVPERVRCDLYDYLSGEDVSAFKGSYLTNYSWAEKTLGELLNKHV